MNGYFSQLMQQTGISLSNPGRTPAAGASSEVASTASDRQTLIQDNTAPPSPLEVETMQEVAALLEEPRETLETTSATSSSASARSADRMPSVEPEIPWRSSPQIPAPLLNMDGPGASLEPLEMPSSLSSLERFEQVEVQMSGEPFPPLSPSIPSTAAIELTVDWQTPATEAQFPLPTRSLEALDEQIMEGERSPESPLSSQSPPLTRQAYLQAALDWVAGNPQSAAQQLQGLEQLSEIPTPWNSEPLQQSTSQTGLEARLEAIANSEPRTPPLNPLQEQTHWQNTQPQTQELTLSIGTISVTLATPPPPSPPSPPPPLHPSTPPPLHPSTPTPSRLNRHYLRLG